MVFSMKDKVVIVTGGTRGIGFGIVKVFAENKAKVAFTGRNEQNGKKTELELKSQGFDVLYIKADSTSESSMKAAMKTVYEKYGKINIVINSAGVFPKARLGEMTLETWDEVHNLNLRGLFITVNEALPYLKKEGKGKIVAVGSITGPITGNPGMSAYSASKAGVMGFIRTACLELAPFNININAVQPGNVMTPGMKTRLGPEYIKNQEAVIPQGKLGDVEDVAYAVLFLASDEAKYITGQSLTLDGGQTVPESQVAMK